MEAADRIDQHVQDQVLAGRHAHLLFDGRSVEIFEIRAGWEDPALKHEEAVAKARYLKTRNVWLVYWKRADLKWHRYDPAPEVRTIDAFLKLVDEDEYACFYG